MRNFLLITLLTVASGFLGFLMGYVLFARYGDEYIPLGLIFLGDPVHDGVLNSVLFLKPKILATAGFFAFFGCVIAVLVTLRGRKIQEAGFYTCSWCGFQSRQIQDFCDACERDQKGMTRDDYKKKAWDKISRGSETPPP
jgi:hypothetical protein